MPIYVGIPTSMTGGQQVAACSEQANEQKGQRGHTVPHASQISVLLVEDADDEREMYAASLRLHGYRTLQASTGDDAIRLATELRPAAIVTDVVLRGSVDGFTLTRLLKEDRFTRDTPVVILTGRVFEADRERAAGVGCDVFLTKPCLPDELFRTVRRCAAAHRLARTSGRAVSATVTTRGDRSMRKADRG